MIFKDGVFAQFPLDKSKSGKDAPKWSLVAAAINSLWSSDGVFIMKLTDKALGKGAGQACKHFPTEMTICRDGIAYIWMRWAFEGGVSAGDGGGNFAVLSPQHFYAWGAYSYGTAMTNTTGKTKTKNEEALSKYDLTLDDLTTSTLNLDAAGKKFPYKNQNGDILTNLLSNTQDSFSNKQKLMAFSIPICDLDFVLGQGGKDGKGYHLKDRPGGYKGIEKSGITEYGACTCLMDPDWPKDLEGGVYDPPEKGYGDWVCKEEGWAENK